jgi:predicted O-methyltransferase YrrM
MAALENRLTVRLGTAIGASTSLMLAALALLR